ncbi:MAG TPA: OmpA family protein [Paracoccaceae bacterium]|nr:OmpA family protein [Paracoccaceae bacterium]
MALVKTMGVAALAGVMVLAGCTNPDGTTNNTTSGTAIGAVAGGLFGRAISDDKTAGTLIGAAAGAAIGNVVGRNLDAQAAELRNTMPAGVSIVNTGSQLIVTLPEAITFPVNSTEIRYSIQDDLVTLARSMNDYPNTRVDVIGHTDSTGSAAYNQDLSERRALAVRAALVGNGVSPSRVFASGLGETQPVASNATADGRAQNRRVEIFITPY